jgi:hypothetical protein
MNDQNITKEEAWSLLFLLRADEFYILTRYSYCAFLQYSPFRLAHHALEYYLKSGLSHFITLKQLKSFGHKVTDLWKEYRCHTPNVTLDDRVVEHIDCFESMRYPGGDKFARTAWGLPYQDLFDNIMPNVSQDARDSLACFSMEDIDHIVYILRSSIPHGDKLPFNTLGEDQERYLFHENKYFTKKENEKN